MEDDEGDAYIIDLDGRWSLDDLYRFPRTFEQVYFLVYSLSGELDDEQSARMQFAFATYPWQGGYSAVNFYNSLKRTAPISDRPRIGSIHYASPGWLELISISIPIALSVGVTVRSVTASIRAINTVYNDIIKGMMERRLLRIEVQHAELGLQRENQQFIEESAQRMASALQLASLDEINDRTGDPYRSLKIMLSLYRRIRTLSEYEISGKAKLPTEKRKKKK